MTTWAARGPFPNDASENQPVRPVAPRMASRVIASVLRVPLMVKLLGATVLINVAIVLEPLVFPGGFALTHPVTVLVLSFGSTAMLAWLALRPVALLESTAARVSAGDFDARVPDSPLADRALARLSSTMNTLLNRIQADRARIQYLAGRAVRARDIERESVSRELRESLAQTVAGIAMQIAAIRQSPVDAPMARRLDEMRTTVADLTEEIRGMAEALHPGTIGEFGLANALQSMGRVVSRRTSTAVRVDADHASTPLPPQASSALYRVADEALRNIVLHAHASHAAVKMVSDAEGVTLEIEDDGRGFDVTTVDPLQAGLGLFSARAVLALVGGELHLSGAPGRGVRVTAKIPHSALNRGTWQATS